MTLPEAHKQFTETFHTKLNPFLDGLLMVATKKPVIDVFKFDDWLHEQHGNYEDKGKCMADILNEKYGKDAFRLVKELACPGAA
ncbi:hypothetical protein AGMMS49579_24240 [Spirochaetia bacterium]|nr:hypothetical protein AGMMS49579_24240 [Spirochaetia bacterium]